MEEPTPRPPAQELALLRRVSDAEREQVADLLRDAAGDGRLSYLELEERLETTYAAKTYGELVEVSADLPNGLAQPTAAAGPVQPAGEPAPSSIRVFMSDSKRAGTWLAPRQQDVHAVMGEVNLDYTEAQIPGAEVFIDIKAILADVKIRVPDNAIVHLVGKPIIGTVSEKGTRTSADDTTTPTVFHITGTAILAEIKVRRGPTLTKRLGLA